MISVLISSHLLLNNPLTTNVLLHVDKGDDLHLEIMRPPHQMEQITNVEEPILDGVDGEADFLGDDSREVIAHDLGTVVLVAQPLA